MDFWSVARPCDYHLTTLITVIINVITVVSFTFSARWTSSRFRWNVRSTMRSGWSDKLGYWTVKLGYWSVKLDLRPDKLGHWSVKLGHWSNKLGYWSNKQGDWSNKQRNWSNKQLSDYLNKVDLWSNELADWSDKLWCRSDKLVYVSFINFKLRRLPSDSTCGQSYKHFTIVNYDSRVVIWANL